MKVLDRKLLRDLESSKGMLFAVTAIIAVGIGCLVGMLATYNNLENSLTSYYARCRMADFWVDLKKAPVVEVERVLSGIPGISEARERISFPVVVDLDGVDRPISGLAVSLPDSPEPVIDNIVLRSGSYFTSAGRNEAIVSEKFAAARSILPGDTIKLVLNGQKKKVYVVGTAISSEHVYIAPPGNPFLSDPGEYGIFYIKREFAEDVFGFHGACNSIVGLLTPQARREDREVLDEINRRLSPYGVFAVTPRSQQFSNLSLHSEMGGLKTTATTLPLIFLSVAALVLNVLMTRMAEQQRLIVGTLKALGYANRELFTHFLKFGLLVGLTGGVIGCILGQVVSDSMISLYQNFFEFPRLVSRAYPSLMFSALLISVTFAVLGTLRGVGRVVKLNPAEAMHESMPETGGAILLERWRVFWTRLDFWWQIVLRGFFRNKVRTLIGVTAAIMGSALMLLAFGLTDSMTYMVDFQFDKVLLADYTLAFREAVDYGVVKEVAELPGVTLVEPVFNVACTFSNGNHEKKGAITGLIPASTLNIPRQEDGTAVRVPPAGVLLTERLAHDLDVREGDSIDFVPVRGVKKRNRVKVVKTVKSMLGLSVYADYSYLNHLVGEAAAVTEVQVKAKQTPRQRRDFLRQLKRYPRLESVSVVRESKAAIGKQMTGAMKGMAGIMILFAGVIFFGSILNGSLISIAERKREIATFRVLGYQSREVGGMFIRENLTINLLGAFLGLPVGYWMLQGLARQYNTDVFTMPAVVDPASWFWPIVYAVIFVLASHLVVQRTINRLHWGEALAMKE